LLSFSLCYAAGLLPFLTYYLNFFAKYTVFLKYLRYICATKAITA
jgi:hypothetical protein